MSPVRSRRVISGVIVTLIMLCATAERAISAGLEALAVDGLYTWRVAATDDAPCWCCVNWSGKSYNARPCDLDSRNASYSVDDSLDAAGEMRIYALIESGKATRIRTFSPQCAVTSRRDIIDLGTIQPVESLAWLQERVTSSTVGPDALAAIAVHRDPAALRFLLEIAASGPAMGLRKDAIFWMAQGRISESASELERMMFKDPDPEIRRHAAFSLSQSSAPNRTDALIRQGRDDEEPEVRSQAWFWLAQTGSSESEKAIQWAIANDPEGDVREEAVFALSQLPGERGVDALFAVLRDRGLHREIREQALFWLAQSDSDRAFAYLDELLAGRN
jgi:HEAT repeat protein